MSLTTKVGIEVTTNAAKAAQDFDKLGASTNKASQASKSLSDNNKTTREQFDGIASKAALAAAAVTAVALAFDKASSQSIKFQAVQSALTISIDKARDATLGLVDDMTLMTSANQAVRLGVVKNEEEFAKLTEIATKLALSTGQDATKGVQDLTTALARQSPQILDNLGLQVDVNKANADYAASLGKSASALTEAEKKQAFVNAALAEGEKAANAFNLEVDSGALTIQQFKTSLINFTNEAASAFTGFLASASEGLGDLLENVADFNAEYGLDGRGGLKAADGNNYYRRQSVRGMGGIAGSKGEPARAEAMRVKAARESLALNQETLRQGVMINEMSAGMVTATDKITESLQRQNKGRKQKIDLFKEERALFQSELGQVEMARAGSALGTARDRDAFNDQLGGAQMADAGQKAKAAQVRFEEETAEKRKKLLEDHNRALEESLEVEIRAEQRKREEIEMTMRSRMEIASATQALTSQSAALAGFAAEAGIKGGKRREAAMKAIAGSELITIGIVETVKAVAAFAGFNYVEGALHVGAAALAYARGGQLLSQAGGSGGGGGPSGGFAGAAAFGGGGAADSGGATQSSTGGGDRPSSNGPISESEESVQRSGRGGRPGPTRNRDRDGAAPTVNLFHLGALDDGSLIKIDQGLAHIRRKSGRNSS